MNEESSETSSPASPEPEWFRGCTATAEGMVLLSNGTPSNIRFNRPGFYSYPIMYPGIEVALEPEPKESGEIWSAWATIRQEVRQGYPIRWKITQSSAKIGGSSVVSKRDESEERADVEVPGQEKKWEGGIRLRYKEVPTAYVDIRSGEGIMSDVTFKTTMKKPSLSQIIEVVPPECRRIYLVGPKPGRGDAESLYAWFRDRQVGESWRVQKFLQDDDLPLLDLVERHSSNEKKSRTLRIQRMAQWFDDDLDYTPAQAQEAMQLLDILLQKNFDQHARTLNTPGSTGLALWDRNRHITYPVLEPEVQRLIRATSGQGRFELCSLPDRPQLPGFAYLDGRFMYAALCTGLGFGPASHEVGPFDLNEINWNRRGRYKVHFKVPLEWQHVGLLPLKDDDGETWLYPFEPGFEGETWADAVEVRLAVAQGWDIHIQERLLLQSASKEHPWPLDTWAKRLIDMRTDIAARVTHQEIPRTLGELVLQGLRGILLHAVGGFHRSDSFETVIVYSSEELQSVPARYQMTSHSDGTWTYRRAAPLDQWSRQFQHPEWSAAIWARCRTRLLVSETKKMGKVIGESTGVLTLPRSALVGMRVDAMYLTLNPQWADNGQPGKFRLKGFLEEPVPQPIDYETLNALRDRSVAAWRQRR